MSGSASPQDIADEQFTQDLARDLQETRKRWNFLHKFYLFTYVVLVIAALVLSGGVVPLAVYYENNDLAFISGLVVALLIGIQNAFAIGGRWTFYSSILAEIEALSFQFRRRSSNHSKKELQRISERLEQINTRGYTQLPRGQGIDVVEKGTGSG